YDARGTRSSLPPQHGARRARNQDRGRKDEPPSARSARARARGERRAPPRLADDRRGRAGSEAAWLEGHPDDSAEEVGKLEKERDREEESNGVLDDRRTDQGR